MTDDKKNDLRQALDNPTPVKGKGGARKKTEAPVKPKPVEEPKDRAWFPSEAPTLPDDCPVVPLGRDARRYAFIDGNKQFVEVEVTQLGSDGIADLFAHPKAFTWLWQRFPRYGKDGHQNGYDKERCKIALMQACAAKGPFDFSNRVRGVGAWSDSEGRLHWHLGDQIMVVTPEGLPVYEEGPLVHGYVYPRGMRQPRPADKRDADAVVELYKLLQRWMWLRGEVDARLILGWICSALIGGALKWRPHTWVRGPRGSGKSVLQFLLSLLAGGDDAIVQASDATGAGIWQALRSRSLPVALDEMEAKKGDTRHTDNVINLARQAASGGKILRGGSSHTSHEFTAYAAFLFSSINVPPLEPQDLTRIGQVRLLETPAGVEELSFSSERMLEIGRVLRRILVDGWSIWPRVLSAWRDALIQQHQFEPRIADTWGGLLAMADLVLNAEELLAEGGAPAPADLRKWTAAVAPDIKRMLVDSGSEWERMLKRMLQHKLDPYTRGQRWPIETLIAIAAGRKMPADIAAMVPEDMKADRANSGLIAEGLKVLLAEDPETKKKIWVVAVQRRHAGLDVIFEDTKWKDGVYEQQFEQVPGSWSGRQRYAAGKREPSIMLPLDQVLGEAATPLEAAIADAAEDRAMQLRDEPPPASLTGSTSIAEVIRVYQGSDGEATKVLLARLEAMGELGAIAAQLFRAQKNSERAKQYRGGGFRRAAYDRKGWAMGQLVAVLHVTPDPGIRWGWDLDYRQPVHRHVLYVDLPTGQVSFHAAERGAGPDYVGGWDGRPGQSADRILRWIARLLDGR